jgi:two-component system, LytTR family, response regulator
MSRAVIIDDEVSGRNDLRALLAAHPEVALAGEAATFDEARALLRRGDYDLVFLDVQLLGGSGFDLVPDVRPEARIIFVTAYDQFALRAFEVNALDFLHKPVRTARLAETLRRATAAPFATPPPVLRADDLVQVKTGPGAARLVRVADIVLVGSQDNYSEVLLASGEHILVRQTLASWEERLPASHFLRVHRQAIVNVACIEGFTHESDEITLLRMAKLREPVRARRQHWAGLQSRLTALGRKL